MTFSKSSKVLGLAAVSALIFEVGCGTNNGSDSKSRLHAKHGMAAHSGAKAVDPNAKKTAAIEDPKAKAGADDIAKQEAALQSSPMTTLADLNDGVYKLSQIQTVVTYKNQHPVESLVATLISQYQENVTLAQNPSTPPTAFGDMTAFTDSERKIDMPISFEKTPGWKGDRNSATNVTFSTQFVAGTTKKMSDILGDNMIRQASVLGILSTGTPTITKTDAKYVGADENGLAITVRLFKVSDKVLRIWMTIDEKTSDQTSASASAQSVDFTRSIYFDYSITAKAPVTTDNQAPAGQDDSGVVPTSATDASAAPATSTSI